VTRFDSERPGFSGFIPTPLFMSPEVFRDDLSYDNRIDVFAYGGLVYRIFTNANCLPSCKPRTLEQLRKAIVGGERFMSQPGIPQAFWKLIKSYWKQEPEKRPSFHEITEMMLTSDDFTFPGTYLDEYHEYQSRIVRETNDSPIRGPSVIHNSIPDIGMDLPPMAGLSAFESEILDHV
jgi:serine/threonine protein kinase